MKSTFKLIVPAFIITSLFIRAADSQDAPGVALNFKISAGGQLVSDGKGMYYTGKEYVAAWLEPRKWPDVAFDICMNWPFSKPPHPTRTLKHHLTSPVADGGGAPQGVFDNPAGNDIVIAKPLTSEVNTFTDIVVGSSVLADSTEVRFCNSDCTEYYSLVFGAESVFYRNQNIHGAGTTKARVTRTSSSSWTVTFPPNSIGRFWRRSGNLTSIGLYYYQGQIDILTQ
jgi:hypothetical protein